MFALTYSLAKRKKMTARKNRKIFRWSKTRRSSGDNQERQLLLSTLNVREFFKEGTIAVDAKTCRGVDCKLCVKACPTNAVFWNASTGRIGLIEELCVYCGACMLSCIVDGCIRITRKRQTGEVETFGNVESLVKLQQKVNAENRMKRINEAKEALPSPERFRQKRRRK